MTDDDEIEFIGFIDRQGKSVVKFQLVNEDWKLLETMNKEAQAREVPSWYIGKFVFFTNTPFPQRFRLARLFCEAIGCEVVRL